MQTADNHIEKILKILKLVKQKYTKDGITLVGVFGSVARGETHNGSDIDILYKTQKGIENLYDKKSLLKEELQNILKTKVDLANEKYIKPYAKESIIKDLIYV